MRTDIYSILKAELQPQSTATQLAVRAGRRPSAGGNVSERVDGSLDWTEVKRNVMFQPSYIFAVLKSEAKTTMTAYSERCVQPIRRRTGFYVDVWAKERTVNH